jgi:hypothetical protein
MLDPNAQRHLHTGLKDVSQLTFATSFYGVLFGATLTTLFLHDSSLPLDVRLLMVSVATLCLTLSALGLQRTLRRLRRTLLSPRRPAAKREGE